MKRFMIILAFILLLNQNVTMASEYYDDEIEIKLNHGWGIVMSDVVKHLEILPGSPAEIFVENGREYVIAKGYGDITVLIHTEKRAEPYRYLLHCRSEAEKIE